MDLGVTDAVLASIEVTPANPTVPLGLGSAFQATGLFSDAGTQDLTQLVTWSSSDESVATISNAAGSKGFAQSVGGGTTEITATYAGTSASTTLNVTIATLVSIDVTPVDPFVPAGYSLRIQAVGNYDDGSSRDLNAEVLWSSSNTSVATISNSLGSEGIVTGRAVGGATLSATFPGVSGTTFLTVTNESLQSIEVEPNPVTLALRESTQMSATGFFSGGSVVDLTFQVKWQVTPRSVATITNTTTHKGMVTARKTGNTTIRASKLNKLGTASLTVINP
jgi:hypothetical protein